MDRRARSWLATAWRRRRLVAATVAATLGVLVLGAGVVMSLGLYNVAASSGHWPVVEMVLRFAMERSVKARAPRSVAENLDDADRIRLGAAHYQLGCAPCHGSPIRQRGAASRSMLPDPPDLRPRIGLWRDGELFWIVRHGIKYTGMPAWPAATRDDEVWSVIAFLRRLPDLDGATYRTLALGAEPAETAQDRTDEAMNRCAACHGRAEGPASALVPVLNGQPAERLLLSLERYAAGERQSGIMQEALADLSPATLKALAERYAALSPPPRSRPAVPAGTIARGEMLARQGDVARGIPPCLTCHGEGALPLYPRLAGQPAAFLASQLQAMKAGANTHGAGAIMTPIARALEPDDVTAAASYFASLPLGEGR